MKSFSRHPWLLGLLVGLGMLVGAGPVFAQAVAAPEENDFWLSRERQRPAAAAEVVLAGSQNPFLPYLLRSAGKRLVVWEEEEFIGFQVPQLDVRLLHLIRDNMPTPNFVGKAADEITKEERASYDLYNQAVAEAFRTPLDAFKESAKELDYVRFSHLYTNPNLYRGQVVPIKGTMTRLRKWEASRVLQEKGIKFIYEGWVFGDTRNAHPYCIVFPILPEGLKEAESMRTEVTFYGYFIKKLKYRASNGNDLITPFLIGPTVVPAKAPASTRNPGEKSNPFPVTVLVVLIAMLSAIGIIYATMVWWFRRNDQLVRQQVREIQERQETKGTNKPPSWMDEDTNS